jgi:hypothetical protein
MRINFTAPCNTLGFGIFSTIYYKILKSRGHEIHWNPIGNPNPGDMIDICHQFNKGHQITAEDLDADMCKDVDIDCPMFTIWHPHQADYYQGETTKRVCLTHFETSALEPREVRSLNTADIVYCCSKWGANVM